jgi:hypothetical protein
MKLLGNSLVIGFSALLIQGCPRLLMAWTWLRHPAAEHGSAGMNLSHVIVNDSLLA